DRNHQQRGRDRPPDEWRRDAHGADARLRSAVGGALRDAVRRDLDTGAGTQLVLPVEDDLLITRQAALDQRYAVAGVADLDRTLFHRLVGLDHIGERAVRAALDDLRRHGLQVAANAVTVTGLEE